MIATFKEQFDNSYQTVLTKDLVAMKIASTRFEGELSYGKTLRRAYTDVINVPVQNLVSNTNYTINTVNDSSELITINQNKAIVFAIDSVEKIQAGPLKPGEFLGALAARKLMRYVDGDVLNEIRNAAQTFDTGDLTSTQSNGTPISLSTANVAAMVSQAEAKLGYINVTNGALAMVVDSYSQSQFAQFLLGKQNNLSVSTFENGYIGSPTYGTDMYVSNNLPVDLFVNLTTNPANGDTMTIRASGGKAFTYTFVTVLAAVPGSILIGAAATNTRDNLVTLMTAPGVTTATGVAFTDVAGVTPTTDYVASSWIDLRTTTTNISNQLQIVGVGTGRLGISFTGTIAATTFVNKLHAFFGKKGSTEVVIQDKITAEIVDHPFQFAQIFRSRALYGIKSFKIGIIQMLDVQLA